MVLWVIPPKPLYLGPLKHPAFPDRGQKMDSFLWPQRPGLLPSFGDQRESAKQLCIYLLYPSSSASFPDSLISEGIDSYQTLISPMRRTVIGCRSPFVLLWCFLLFFLKEMTFAALVCSSTTASTTAFCTKGRPMIVNFLDPNSSTFFSLILSPISDSKDSVRMRSPKNTN